MSKPNFKCTGNDIRRMRLAAKKTTQEMADLVGISRQTYENYENDIGRFSHEYFQVWCMHCGIDLSPIIEQFMVLRQLIDDSQLRRKSPSKTKKVR
ncbi:helix-turn-helix transcriptional regulator [Pseudoalteromonas sp. T1lg65]|uniref:helix-turn-helix transcriptional regulator n=1 Tax=Pseudoalteromonas sp. T1lg65 TaxID=2077101 RepID=UPI003F7B3528